MTEAEVSRIESALGVSLPGHYRTVLLHYPEDLLDVEYPLSRTKLAADMLYFEADEVIRRNRRARESYRVYSGGAYGPWPERYLAIGNNGGGDEWCIDLTDERGAVWQWDHERCAFRIDKPSVAALVEYLRRYFDEVRREDARRRESD